MNFKINQSEFCNPKQIPESKLLQLCKKHEDTRLDMPQQDIGIWSEQNYELAK